MAGSSGQHRRAGDQCRRSRRGLVGHRDSLSCAPKTPVGRRGAGCCKRKCGKHPGRLPGGGGGGGGLSEQGAFVGPRGAQERVAGPGSGLWGQEAGAKQGQGWRWRSEGGAPGRAGVAWRRRPRGSVVTLTPGVTGPLLASFVAGSQSCPSGPGGAGRGCSGRGAGCPLCVPGITFLEEREACLERPPSGFRTGAPCYDSCGQSHSCPFYRRGRSRPAARTHLQP